MADIEKQKRIKFNQDIFVIGFCVLVFKLYMIDSSSLMNIPGSVDLLCKAIFSLCMVYKLANQSYRLWQILLFMFLGIMCVYTSLRIENFYLVFSFLGIAAMQDVNLRYVLKHTYILKTSILTVHIIIYFINLVINPGSLVFSSRTGEDIRHFFYMGHANTFSGYVLWTSLEYVYVNYNHIKKKQLMAVLGINFFFYLFADSNTCMTAICILTILMLLDKKDIPILKKVVLFFAKYGFLIFTVLFAMACALYTKMSGALLEFFKQANEFFTGRLLFGAYVYDINGFTFLGRTLSFPPKIHWREYWFDAMVFDNAYIWMLVLGGALYLFLISFGFIWVTKKTSYLMNVLLIGYLIYGVTEAYIINAANCFPLLFIGMLIHKTFEKEKTFHEEKGTDNLQERRQTAYEKVKHLNTGL